jgi:16S rRNA (adenine1518-N6/adenine1519-N6)-dimethyltransferase
MPNAKRVNSATNVSATEIGAVPGGGLENRDETAVNTAPDSSQPAEDPTSDPAPVPIAKAATRPSGSRAKPKLGQNFLADRSAAQKIVEALGDISQQTVLEIGPGRGALTDLLAKRAQRLIAIELDRVLAAQLRMKFTNWPNVEVIEADVLAVDFDTLLGPRPGLLHGFTQAPPKKIRAVGNLPYYITSDILLRLLRYHRYFETIVIMVQKEVADRIAAKPGSRDYGLLTATTHLYASVEKLFTLPPGAFSPPPEVHSSVLRLTIAPRFEELGVEPEPFDRFLKLSFAQKRKTLVNNLREKYQLSDIKAALSKHRVRPDVRAEALSLEKAAAVYRSITQK